MSPVPWATEEELQFLCCFKCTVDGQRGIQKHHIDGNHKNNVPDNWAMLCPNCHDQATRDLQTEQTMTTKLTQDKIKTFRKMSIQSCVYIRIGTTRLRPENDEIEEELGRPTDRTQNPPLIERALKWLNGEEV